ncbi:MAG TPA: class I SAM-dependent methyltransferase [Longilinea sp.]|nr:class I SAM-dependent methyltransferase [Longilinea sp.]
MEEREYKVMFKAEDCHWWYRGMDAITKALLTEYLPAQTDLFILDAGCGTGKNMSDTLSRFGKVNGIDISSLALSFCQQRYLSRLSRSTITALPFPSNQFDLVTSFDVLYSRHVENDAIAIAELWRVLKPGGWILIRVASYEWLRGKHDIAVHTGRRYNRITVKELLQHTGFSIEKLSYANCFLFPLVAIKRFSEKFSNRSDSTSDVDPEPGLFNRLFMAILSAEGPLIKAFGLPFGSSVVCLGRKE